MWTRPVEPGTGCSDQVPPSSSLIMTALVSRSPDHFSPGAVRQRKTGSSRRPVGRTTGGWRTKTPPRPGVAGNRVRVASQVVPWSWLTRSRTSAVSWSPPRWAVCSSHRAPEGMGKSTGFCSERAGSSERRTGSVHVVVPGASLENHTLMSAMPSCVPPNQTQPRSPPGSTVRLAAWLCTVGAGSVVSVRSKPSRSRLVTVPLQGSGRRPGVGGRSVPGAPGRRRRSRR